MSHHHESEAALGPSGQASVMTDIGGDRVWVALPTGALEQAALAELVDESLHVLLGTVLGDPEGVD